MPDSQRGHGASEGAAGAPRPGWKRAAGGDATARSTQSKRSPAAAPTTADRSAWATSRYDSRIIGIRGKDTEDGEGCQLLGSRARNYPPSREEVPGVTG